MMQLIIIASAHHLSLLMAMIQQLNCLTIHLQSEVK